MIQTQFRTLSWFVGLIIVSSGCSSSDNAITQVGKPDSTTVSIVAGVEPTQVQKDHMLAAKDALFTQLSSRLMEVMSSQGPTAAILVCQQEAPKIASEVSATQGLQIGRTGVRLRNPKNKPPQWATSLIEAQTDTPTFAKLSNGHAAALLPIMLQIQCLMCHGPKEQIAPEIQEQLTKLYPNDEATGFTEGELRGWFWIDLPIR
jgi:hypothetical protein